MTITWSTRADRDAAFDKLTAAVLGTDQSQSGRSTLAEAMDRLNSKPQLAETGHTSQAEATEEGSASAA